MQISAAGGSNRDEGMRPIPGITGPAEPQSAEEAVVVLLLQAGRRLKTRHTEDAVDPSAFPLARQLMAGTATRVSDLALRVGLDISTVSRQIKQLEDKGIVERTPDPADGRACLVQLTPEGEITMHSAFRRRIQRIESVLAPWSAEDRAQLQALLTRLADDLHTANERAVAGLNEAPEP
jgi:DNA-binding MarR family transcriptional regulator